MGSPLARLSKSMSVGIDGQAYPVDRLRLSGEGRDTELPNSLPFWVVLPRPPGTRSVRPAQSPT